MSKSSQSYSPLVRACAVFGALFCLFAAIVTVIEALAYLPSVFGFVWSCLKAGAILYLSWCFWYAYKYVKNPFHISPFSRW